jgi:hypothetical protein
VPAVVLLATLIGGASYLSQSRVPIGQQPLVTIDETSLPALRDAFNRDVAHVRIIVLPSPT